MIGCVHIPHFAAQIESHLNPKLNSGELILVDEGNGSVYAVDSLAFDRGVRPKMSLGQAAGLCPDATIIPAGESRYRRVFGHLLEVLWTFSDLLEPLETERFQASAACYLALGRMKPAVAVSVGQHISGMVAKHTAITPLVCLAPDRFTARIVALRTPPGGVRVINRARQAAFLASQPVTMLPDKVIAERLWLLGVRTFGQFAQLPGSAVLSQFGKAGRELQRYVQGKDKRRLNPHRREKQEQISHSFDTPVVDRSILEALLSKLALELTRRLDRQGLVCSELGLVIQLDGGAVKERAWRPPLSITGPLQLTRYLSRLAGQMEILSAVTELEITLRKLKSPLPRQLELFPQTVASEGLWDGVLSDLIARHSPHCFHRVRLTSARNYVLERRFRLDRAG